jgi:protocatechuate 3,4-dioxygenase beta subunit
MTLRKAHLLFLLPAALYAQTGATVEGTVADPVTHQGVSGVAVTLWTQKGTRYTADTDSSGSFRIAGVEPGEYRSRYEKPGFQTLEMPRFGEPTLQVGIGGSHRLNVEIAKFGILRGRVFDPEGKPAPGVSVEIGPLSEAITDTEGRFTLTNLRPGTYTLLADVRARDHTSDKGPRAEIIPTYFPSAIDQADADRIVIHGGADLDGFDIRLRKSPVFRLKGVVLDELGKPVPQASVRLLRPSSERLLSGVEMIASVQSFINIPGFQTGGMIIATGDDGRFEFPAVRPGEWHVQAELDPTHDKSNETYQLVTPAVPVGVSDHDVLDLELRFDPSFPLEIVPDWGDRKPPTGATSAPAKLFRTDSGNVPVFGRTNKEGITHFGHLVPARYRIVPGLNPAGSYAAAVLVDGRDVLGQDVMLTGSSSVRIMYKPNPGGIHGTVEQGEGATVLLWSQAGGIPYMVPAVKAGANGSFEFNNIAPGTYSVLAFDQVNAQNVSRDYVLRAVANAQQVKVDELGVASLTLTLTYWPD